MLVILIILLVLLAVLLGTVVVSSSLTSVAMSDALRAQAQATQALAVAELIRTLTGFVGVILALAVIVLVIVVVNKRRAARNVTILPRPVAAPQLTSGTQIEQLTQLFTLQLMRDMAKQQSLYSADEKEQRQ